jgi:hypothetical protein
MQEQTHQTQDVTQLKSPYPSPVQKQDDDDPFATMDVEAITKDSRKREQNRSPRSRGADEA